MTKEELNHIETNLEVINVWIDNHSKLQYSDTTKPIFNAFERETKNSINGCDDCKIDALIWARAELKKSKETIKETTKKK